MLRPRMELLDLPGDILHAIVGLSENAPSVERTCSKLLKVSRQCHHRHVFIPEPARALEWLNSRTVERLTVVGNIPAGAYAPSVQGLQVYLSINDLREISTLGCIANAFPNVRELILWVDAHLPTEKCAVLPCAGFEHLRTFRIILDDRAWLDVAVGRRLPLLKKMRTTILPRGDFAAEIKARFATDATGDV